MAMRLVFVLLALALVACGNEVGPQDSSLIGVEIIGLYDYPEGGIGVFLQDADSRVVPIIIGPYEARALRLAIGKKNLPRPVSYDLLVAVLEQTNTEIRHLVIHSIRDNVFHAELVLDVEGETSFLDCRPSDGMVIATLLRAPIYLTQEVMEQAGTNLRETEKVYWNPPAAVGQFRPTAFYDLAPLLQTFSLPAG